MLDQHRVIHGVEPIIGATPGRLLIYVPIIPYGYIQKWFAFEGFPWRVCFSEKDTAPWERGAAYCKNALDVLMNRQKIHSTRKLFKHHSHCLGTYSKNQEDPHEVVSVRK
jgi:hypothetical protein